MEFIDFMVFNVKHDQTKEGMGRQSFRVAPQKADYITFDDDNGTSHLYQVVAVFHPAKPASTAGDLYLKYLGIANEYEKKLLKEI